MQKSLKILLILSSVAIALVLYLFIKIEPINKNVKENLNEEKVKIASVDLEKLENEYKAQVKDLFIKYSELLPATDLNPASFNKIKNDLLDLKLPTQLKDLHINFVLAVTKMENYLESGDDEEKISSQELIEKIKADYAWLN